MAVEAVEAVAVAESGQKMECVVPGDSEEMADVRTEACRTRVDGLRLVAWPRPEIECVKMIPW